jgi:hypothetical protein
VATTIQFGNCPFLVAHDKIVTHSSAKENSLYPDEEHSHLLRLKAKRPKAKRPREPKRLFAVLGRPLQLQ